MNKSSNNAIYQTQPPHRGWSRIIPRIIRTLSLALLIVGPVTNSVWAFTLESNITLNPGFRTDDLNWNVAGNSVGTNPNIEIETKWKAIRTVQLQIGTEMLLNRTFYFKGFANYGSVYDGTSQEAFYAGDNRTGIYQLTRSGAGKGDVSDAGVSIGLFLPVTDTDNGGTLSIIPQLGFSTSTQNFWMKGSYIFTFTGTYITTLNNYYQSQWYGPWVGLDLRFQATPYSSLAFRYERHSVNYYAKQDWPEFVLARPKSMEHEANGKGDVLALGWRTELEKNWLIGLDIGFQQWTTNRGDMYYHWPDNTTSGARLNEVKWNSTSVTLIFGKFFPAF